MCRTRTKKSRHIFIGNRLSSETLQWMYERDENAMRIRQNPSTNYFNSMLLRIMLPCNFLCFQPMYWDTGNIGSHVCVVVFLGDLSGRIKCIVIYRLAYDSCTLCSVHLKGSSHTRFESLISHYSSHTHYIQAFRFFEFPNLSKAVSVCFFSASFVLRCAYQFRTLDRIMQIRCTWLSDHLT